MDEATESEFDSIEELQAALEYEQNIWNTKGLSLQNVNFGNLSVMLLDLTAKVQALTNVLILNDVMSEDQINFQYKLIMLNNLRTLRESAPEQQKEAIRRAIIEGAHIQMNHQKPPWES